MKRSLNRNYQPGFVEVVGTGGLNLGYEFDEVGNLKKLRTASQAEPPLRSYGYDGLNRLTETKDGATNAVLEAYAYDSTGNRTSATVGGTTTAYSYGSASHRLNGVGATARSYDAAGNTIQIGGTAKEFVYDDLNRMSRVRTSGTTTRNYAYNGRGEQVRTWLAANDDRYSMYDEGGQWLGEYDSAGAPTQQIVWLYNLPVAVIAGSGATRKLHYIEADALGTPRVVVDPTRGPSGTAIWRWDLTGEAFGNTAPNQDPDGDGTAFVFDMRFPGQRYDSVTGFNYNYFRDYEPGAGRYNTSDPIGLRGGLSTYGYVSQGPLSLVDPKGLLAFGPTCTPQMRASIIQAVVDLANEITKKANSAMKKCEKESCDFSLAGDVMRNVASMIFSCDNTFLCAQTLANGVAYYHPTILTAPKPSEVFKPGQCGCLKGTIFHEATHQARWDMSENEVRRKTLDCVSCAQNVNESGKPL